MSLIRVLKPSLFIYEFARIIIIIIVMFSQGFSIMMVFAVPGVLFPLMALFMWIDLERNKAYLPLFTAGKCVYIFILVIWFILSKQVTMLAGSGNFQNLAQIIISADLFSLAAVLLIKKELMDLEEIAEIKAEANKSISDTEEN